MKWIGKTYSLGLVTCVVLGVFGSLVVWLLGASKEIEIVIVQDNQLNSVIKAGGLLVLPLVVGLLLRLPFLQVLLLRFFSFVPIPLVSPSAKFLLNVLECVRQRDLLNAPEVKFWLGGHRWAFGVVVTETEEPEDTLNPESPLVTWCNILGPLNPPVFLASNWSSVKKTDLMFTGRVAKDTGLTVACFLINFAVDPKKFHVFRDSKPVA